MHNRSAAAIPIVLTTALTLALPFAAQAAPGRAATSKAGVLARRAATVTLPTGEHLRLSGAGGKEQVVVQPVTASGPGRAVLIHRLGGHTYVMPAVAEPYLNRFLDKNLFDVTALNAALKKNGRLPVRIAYRGSAPAVPGVTITSADGGFARGYLTPKSAAAFGQALISQWKADSKAGFPKRTTLFTGLTKLSADLPASGTVTPKFPMVTLVIKTIGPDGKPQPAGAISLMNVDNGLKYTGGAQAENGEVRVSVPKGTYSAAGQDVAFNQAGDAVTIRISTVNEYKVKRSGQTLTLDYRKATAEPSAAVRRPASVSTMTFSWTRADAQDSVGISDLFVLGSADRLLLTPSRPAKVGTAANTFNWTLLGPGRTPAYSYTLAARQDHIPANARYTFPNARLATIKAAYYGEGAPRNAGLLRYPLFGGDEVSGGVMNPVARGTRRTEYVGVLGGKPIWVDSVLVNYDSWDDPGFIDGPTLPLAPGSSTAINWLKGPLSAAIPLQSGGGDCYTCRYGNTVTVGLAPFTDSYLTHVGSLFGSEDGIPVTRFRFYRNGKLVSDQDDIVGGKFPVSAGKATYRAVLDVDRRLQDPVQSTRTQTELTFSSAKNTGKKLPSNWSCDGDNCRVLPVVQARLGLPLGINGTLPRGKSTVTVTVGWVQAAAKSAITSAGLQIRASGSSWSSITLKSVGGGKYQGVIDNTDLDGYVDVRFGGAAASGSQYRQTVLHAYTVASS